MPPLAPTTSHPATSFCCAAYVEAPGEVVLVRGVCDIVLLWSVTIGRWLWGCTPWGIRSRYDRDTK